MSKRLIAFLFLSLLINLPICFSAELSLTYDSNGNLVNDSKLYYEYNSLNQLVRVKELNGRVLEEYSYDAAGQRIKKVTYNHDGFNIKVYYVDENYVRIINNSGIFDTKYFYHNGQLVARQDPEGDVYYYHPDHLGSTNLVTDALKPVVEETTYLPFGGIFEGGSSRFTFTGKEKDYSGLMYYGARYYSPFLRRFTQPDTVIQNVYDPQSLNRYSYARNNPLKYVDPSGNYFSPWDILDHISLTISVADVLKNPANIRNWINLGIDVSSAVIPGLGGGGMIYRAATKADDVVDVSKFAKLTKNAKNVGKAKKGVEAADISGDLGEVIQRTHKEPKGHYGEFGEFPDNGLHGLLRNSDNTIDNALPTRNGVQKAQETYK